MDSLVKFSAVYCTVYSAWCNRCKTFKIAYSKVQLIKKLLKNQILYKCGVRVFVTLRLHVWWIY
jgi:hypothetical protein